MKTVKVRIAVTVDSDGYWTACGWKGVLDGDAMGTAIDSVGEYASRYWITAELPIPEVPTVAGTVEVAQ
jgi:hypothetical protein